MRNMLKTNGNTTTRRTNLVAVAVTLNTALAARISGPMGMYGDLSQHADIVQRRVFHSRRTCCGFYLAEEGGRSLDNATCLPSTPCLRRPSLVPKPTCYGYYLAEGGGRFLDDTTCLFLYP